VILQGTLPGRGTHHGGASVATKAETTSIVMMVVGQPDSDGNVYSIHALRAARDDLNQRAIDVHDHQDVVCGVTVPQTARIRGKQLIVEVLSGREVKFTSGPIKWLEVAEGVYKGFRGEDEVAQLTLSEDGWIVKNVETGVGSRSLKTLAAAKAWATRYIR
jgi:hypothetical protein